MNIFFITGVQRSGTTLLSFLLSNHSQVQIDDHSIAFRIINCLHTNFHNVLPHYLELSEAEILQDLIQNDYKGRLANLLDHEHITAYTSIQDLLSSSIAQQLTQHDKKIWGNKAPNIQTYLPKLLLLLPQAKIIHLVRDGRATAYSMQQRAHKNLRLSAQKWVDENIVALHNQAIMGKERFKMVRYEELVEQPQKSLSAICDFLEIPFEATILDLTQHKLVNQENAYVQANLDPMKINIYQDKLASKQLRQIEQIQGPLLQKLGYSLLQEHNKTSFRQLSTVQRIWLNQSTNFRAIFRAHDTRMENWEVKKVHIPLYKRLGFFLRMLSHDLFSLPIFLALFGRKHKRLRNYKK